MPTIYKQYKHNRYIYHDLNFKQEDHSDLFDCLTVIVISDKNWFTSFDGIFT